MKHSGKALKAAVKLALISLALLVGLLILGLGAAFVAKAIAFLTPVLAALWVIFIAFTFYFFRDPDPIVPMGPKLVVSPAHGTVDFIGTTTEPLFMGGECQRISIFLSVIDVHVQKAPVAGKITFMRHTPGQFLSAVNSDTAEHNENILLGIEAAEPAGRKIGLRLIAGLIARRIVPWINQGDEVPRGERISLIQFGSRADLYLPMYAKIKIKLKDKVIGGEAILAEFP